MNALQTEQLTVQQTEAKISFDGQKHIFRKRCKLIGDIEIADDVYIDGNSVVVKSILEPNATLADNLEKKTRNNNSHSNLSIELFK